MILQVQQLIRAAMQDIGAIGKSEDPTADEYADGLLKLNFMIDAWSVRTLMVLGAILEDFPLTAGKQFYTIGLGGDFNTPRPSAIDTAFLRDGNNEDTSVAIMTLDDWSMITDKAISTGRVEQIYFDQSPTQQTNPLGVISTYPIPDSSTPYTLFIGQQKALTEFAAIIDVVSFQPAYYEALEYNLAIRLWPQYHDAGTPTNPDIKALAKESMRVIETMNSKLPRSVIEISGKAHGGSNYNIWTGTYQ